MLHILSVGHSVLKKKSVEISPDYPGLDELLVQMFETMYAAKGVGLAAPQIGKLIRLFIIDARPYGNEDPLAKDFVKVFINPRIIAKSGEECLFSEGCLSIPEINEDISRSSEIETEYMNEHFILHKEIFKGIPARIIQHEYDHLEGILFTDRLSPLKKTLLKGKLTKISKGETDVNYKMIFPNKNRTFL